MKSIMRTLIACIFVVTFAGPSYAEPTMSDFTAFPPFISATVEPNILLILDNSGSMNEFAYKEVTGYRCETTEALTGYQEGTKYYGLFDPDLCYKYDN